MNLFAQFEKLSLDLRAEIVLHSGRLLAERVEEHNYNVSLFQIQELYFEVICDPDFSQIDEVRLVDFSEIISLYPTMAKV